ncbi:hypothetical protein CKAH01_17573 [Colletotrichum kahawae]|uniref:Uncharacterized protein n=1 Tax=Colletotrichum kahawae TaxID=34407 RepID=A0AAE0D4I7_COLKA|nr:hypothetical protein CKAH01_17573 [Colletotrichum kahawae]
MTRRNSLALHLTALAALSSVAQLPVLVGAEDLDAEDVPPECVPVCAPIVQLTARCEAQTKQRFGDIDKRVFHDDGAVEYFEARRRHVLAPERVRRRRQRLEERMERRQVQSDSDSDSSGDEAPPQVVAAAEREEKECVCQDTSFDVFGAMNGCAGCIAANVTAVEANEDIREIMADCGFAPPPPPATSSVFTTTTTSTTSLPAVLTDPPAANLAQGGFSTLVPPALAPAGPSTSSTSSTSSTPPPPPQDAPTSTQPPPAAATTPEPEVTPTVESSITPVTVFETPSFRTLPSLVLPNDFAAARGGDRTGSGAATLGMHWVDKVAVVLVLVWALV